MIEYIDLSLEVKGALIEASVSDKESPTLAYFRAEQSLAPSPTMATTRPRFYRVIINFYF
jgi:hypothetical protein